MPVKPFSTLATPALRLTGTVILVPLLTDAASSITPLPAVRTTTHTWTAPWALIALAAVLCALIAAGYVSRRRRGARRAG